MNWITYWRKSKLIKLIFCSLLLSLVTLNLAAAAEDGDGLDFNAYLAAMPSPARLPYTVLDRARYDRTVEFARAGIKTTLAKLAPLSAAEDDLRLAAISKLLVDTPYIKVGAMGEGDWQASADTYQPGALHLNQYPVYRLDGFDCQTLVQVSMALFYSNTQAAFETQLLKIAYGAAGNPQGERVRYYNRNHFADGDFNPINEKQGFFNDVTTLGPFAGIAQTTAATITRNRWLTKQRQQLAQHVTVLNAVDGPEMVSRFVTTYATLPFNQFKKEKVSITYLPKSALLQRDAHGYTINTALFAAIPTPAVIEVVRDAKRWTKDGMRVKTLIGSETSVSHLGFAFRQTFKRGELISRSIHCSASDAGPRCQVSTRHCDKTRCNELMFTHATDAFPENYLFYRTKGKAFVCTSLAPPPGTPYTFCNRVVSVPLADYLLDYQYGHYWYMDMPSLLGIHIEALRARNAVSTRERSLSAAKKVA